MLPLPYGLKPLDLSMGFAPPALFAHPLTSFTGLFQRRDEQDYTLTLTEPVVRVGQTWILITLHPEIDEQLQSGTNQQQLTVWGRLNEAGSWLVVEKIQVM